MRRASTGMTLIEVVVMMSVFAILSMGFLEYQASLQSQYADREMHHDFEMQCQLSQFGAKTRAQDRCSYFRNLDLHELAMWVYEFNQGAQYASQTLEPFFASVLPYQINGVNSLRAGSKELRLNEVGYALTSEPYARSTQVPLQFQSIGVNCQLETVLDEKPNDMTLLPKVVISGCVRGLWKQEQALTVEVGETIGSTVIPLRHLVQGSTQSVTIYHGIDTPLDGSILDQQVKVIVLGDQPTLSNGTKIPSGSVSIAGIYKFIVPGGTRPEYKICEVKVPLQIANGKIVGCGGDPLQKGLQRVDEMCSAVGGEPASGGQCALPGTDPVSVCKDFKGADALVKDGICVSGK